MKIIPEMDHIKKQLIAALLGQHSWSLSSEKLCNLENDVDEAQGMQTASQRPQQTPKASNKPGLKLCSWKSTRALSL